MGIDRCSLPEIRHPGHLQSSYAMASSKILANDVQVRLLCYAKDRNTKGCNARLVLRRKLEDAYQFIQRLNTTDPALQMLAKMLHDAPIIPSHNSTDAHQQFAHDIQQWHQQLDSIHRQAQVAMSNQQQQGLLDVLSILRGDGPTIVKHADTSTEAIVAYLIYHDALASLDEIQQIAKRITISRCDAHQIDERSVNAFAWMLQGRICEALESFPHADWWLLTHILYLFDLIGMRYVGDTIVHLPSPSSKKDIALSFHDLVLLMHTRELAAQPELWQYSLDYLDTCYCKEKRHVGLLQVINNANKLVLDGTLIEPYIEHQAHASNKSSRYPEVT